VYPVPLSDRVQVRKYFRVLNADANSGLRFCEKSSSFPSGERISRKKFDIG
jgi:hypothetical protein